MKKILLIATGGTIASQEGEHGLTPQINSKGMLEYVHQLEELYEIDFKDLLNLDSSNIQPEEWRIIAQYVYEHIDNYDGVVISHGTDTMAYTASILSFMLRNLKKSVVFTGSQLPIDSHLTDARSNLYCAVETAAMGIPGVYVVFNRKIINGCRAVKVRTMGFDAFESVNSPEVGVIYSDGVHINHIPYPINEEPTQLADQLDTDVFLLKLVPGTKPDVLDMVLELGYKGLVIEAFGAGGLHFLRRDLIAKLEKLYQNGVAVVACSQCLYERSDFNLYEVGKKLMQTGGIIPAYDMTTEAAVTKLMWALGQTQDVEEVKEIFATDFAGEIKLEGNCKSEV